MNRVGAGITLLSLVVALMSWTRPVQTLTVNKCQFEIPHMTTRRV